MSESIAQERHRWYLERFLERIDFPATTAEAPPAAPPGRFRLDAPEGRRIDVRVVELLRPPEEGAIRKSVRAFREAVVEAAEEEWSTDPGRPAVEVWVEFSGHEQTTAARDREEVARGICRQVEAGLPEVGGFARLVAGRGRDDVPFPPATPALTVARLPTYSGSRWRVASGAQATELDPDAIRRAADAASAEPTGEGGGPAAADDEDAVVERWFLGVLEPFRRAPSAGIPEGIEEGRYASPFDRIWVYDPGGDEVRALEPADPGGSG